MNTIDELIQKYSSHQTILPPKNDEIEEIEIPRNPKIPEIMREEEALEKLEEIIKNKEEQKKKIEKGPQKNIETVKPGKHKKEAEILDLCELFSVLSDNNIS